VNSRNGYRLLIGIIFTRVSSVAPCSEIASRYCTDSSASFRICGANPLVEIVIWRIFPGGGRFPFSGAELTGGVLFCGSSLVLTWRIERAANHLVAG